MKAKLNAFFRPKPYEWGIAALKKLQRQAGLIFVVAGFLLAGVGMLAIWIPSIDKPLLLIAIVLGCICVYGLAFGMGVEASDEVVKKLKADEKKD